MDHPAEVEFKGITTGWAALAGQAYSSDIELLTGNAVRQDNCIWKVASSAEISVGERMDIPRDLKVKAVNGKLGLHGTGTLECGDTFRIVLRGHYAPVCDSPGEFVLEFSTAKVQNMDTGLRIPLIQHGIITVESIPPTVDVVTDSNAKE